MKITVTIEEQNFEVEVGDTKARPILATINGQTFEVWPEETTPAAAPHAAASRPKPVAPCAPPAVSNGDKTVNAPIPGVIISVSAKVGDTVQYGQELCVLEAMKMKNAIRAGRAGTIAEIFIKEGDQVHHNQSLMSFTD